MECEMNLLILEPYAKIVEKILKPQFPEITIHSATSEEEVGDFIEIADILLTIVISNDLILKAVNLKWIQSLISGVNPILSLPSLRKDILLTSSHGIHGPQVSELVFLFMLALNRNLYRNFQNQSKRIVERWPGTLLYKKKAGILGVGVIGTEVARKCKAFGMTVYGITRTKRQNEYVDYAYGPENLLEVMKLVDYFINIAPSTEETYKMVGARELSVMKKTAFFINVGRGDTVDEEALIAHLKDEKIAGAALDVFAVEPLSEKNPLFDLKNVILTPHIGGMSDIYYEQVLPIFVENLKRYLQGERRNLINYVDWQK